MTRGAVSPRNQCCLSQARQSTDRCGLFLRLVCGLLCTSALLVQGTVHAGLIRIDESSATFFYSLLLSMIALLS